MSVKKKHDLTGHKKHSKHKKKKASTWWILPSVVFCIFALGFAASLAINEVSAYGSFKFKRASVEKAVFYNGVIVEDYDLSGATLAEALEFWNLKIETPNRERSIVFEVGDTSFCVSADEVGYSSNYESVIKNAWSKGRNGTLEERYRLVNRIGSGTERYAVHRKPYDEKMLRDVTDSIAAAYTYDAQDAKILGFDLDARSFTLSESKAGSYVDADALYEEAAALFSTTGGSVRVTVETIEPKVRTEDVSSAFGMITQALTNASSSGTNRITNLKLACEAINGVCVMPGETFSFNQTVGERTKARGYKKATVYSAGELGEDIGGGVCQVSTTLWNAAMKADCEIVERHEHSRPVSYVDRGKDATVSWDSQDMIFKNTSEDPMYIVAYVSENKRVYCEIYGKLLPDGEYITIEAKTTKTIASGDPVRTYNPALKRGEEVVVSEARKGYKASAYRVYHNADGSEIERVLLCTSYYKEAAAKIEYGG